ncbi:hypothetical protein Tco_0214368 [Tanacetum coccineum]
MDLDENLWFCRLFWNIGIDKDCIERMTHLVSLCVVQPICLFDQLHLDSSDRILLWIDTVHGVAGIAGGKGFEQQHGESNNKEVSSDPFNIYNLLDKRTKEVRTTNTSTSIPYPPGFTPANDIPACTNQDIPEAESDRPPSRSARSNSRLLEEARKLMWQVSSESFSNGDKIREGGPYEDLEEMFTVIFPLISAICLDRHLSDHRPILLKEVFSDFGPTPFRFYHSWLELPGFDDLVSKFWNSFTLDDSNGMIRFKKKLQMLKKEIRAWTLDFKRHQVGLSKDLNSKLCDIDKVLDQGGVTDDILLSRLEVLKQLHDVQSSNNRDIMQKAKIR